MPQFNWTPGIGDPSIRGWVTVVLYLACAFVCWRTAHKLSKQASNCTQEIRIWWCVSVLFMVLGVNKQLDLQTALTELGRIIAQHQGWYEHRQTVQLVFIVFIALTSALSAIMLIGWARNSTLPTWTALIGTTMVVGFVLARAASFYHVDTFVDIRVLGWRWNWIAEIGGIVLVLVASYWRLHLMNRPTTHSIIPGN